MANSSTSSFVDTTLNAVANTVSNRGWVPYFVPALLAYSILCSSLRNRRRDAMAKKYNFPDRQSFKRMTNEDAQSILTYMAELEFPKLYVMSLQFALFKTYGIPTISGLLAATKEFSNSENASKRYADTSVLINEFSGHHPKHPRVIKAISRMNYIHSVYQKSGKISQEDLLYTLSVFITEPVVWINQYEWRNLTQMEICAIATFWKSIGDNMGIDYNGRLSKTGWVDGIEFYEDIKDWALKYEEKYMVPAKSNKVTADELVPLLLFYVPKPLKAWAATLVGVLMPERLRKSMMYSTPPKSSAVVVYTILHLRRLTLKYLSLPRPSFMRVRQLVDSPDPKTGRFTTNQYVAHPYYNKPGFWNRWGPEGWFVWALGGDLPGDKGEKYFPSGYIFEEVGPRGMKGKGLKETDKWEEKLARERTSGCPFAFAR